MALASQCLFVSDTTSDFPMADCTVYMQVLESNQHVIFIAVEASPIAVKVHPTKDNQDVVKRAR